METQDQPLKTYLDNSDAKVSIPISQTSMEGHWGLLHNVNCVLSKDNKGAYLALEGDRNDKNEPKYSQLISILSEWKDGEFSNHYGWFTFKGEDEIQLHVIWREEDKERILEEDDEYLKLKFNVISYTPNPFEDEDKNS